jgi:hypothetical protein
MILKEEYIIIKVKFCPIYDLLTSIFQHSSSVSENRKCDFMWVAPFDVKTH